MTIGGVTYVRFVIAQRVNTADEQMDKEQRDSGAVPNITSNRRLPEMRRLQ